MNAYETTGRGEKLLVEFVEIVRILHEFITFTIPYSSFAFFPPPLSSFICISILLAKNRDIYIYNVYMLDILSIDIFSGKLIISDD